SLLLLVLGDGLRALDVHLDRLADHDVAVPVARHGAADVEQVALGVDLDEFEVLDRHALDAVVAAHPLALRHALADRIRATDAAHLAVVLAVAVRHALAMETVALDRAGEAATLRRPGDIDVLDVGECVDAD